MSLKNNVEEHPEQLRCLFLPSDDIPNDTNFDQAVTKFGHKKVFKLMDECTPPVDLLCTVSNLYPFMFASNVSAIDHVLRHATSWVSASTITASHTT